MTEHAQCHETVDPDTRDEVLARDGHQCKTCGREGPEKGGLATLHVHHIERDPDGIDEHDLANLTTLCRSCHSWQHQKTTEEDAPVEISDADLTVLLPQDIEILRILAADGPATTGDIARALTTDLSVMAVRERLWMLMGLDNIVSSRDKQIVDQDVDTGEWGLTGQIANSARGYIPDDPQLLLQRTEDEYVRQALDRGVARKKITAVLDVARRTTFYKEKRAHAYDFPLNALKDGQPPTTREAQEDPSSTADSTPDTTPDGQQQLDVVTDGPDDNVNSPVSGNETETTSVLPDWRNQLN